MLLLSCSIEENKGRSKVNDNVRSPGSNVPDWSLLADAALCISTRSTFFMLRSSKKVNKKHKEDQKDFCKYLVKVK